MALSSRHNYLSSTSISLVLRTDALGTFGRRTFGFRTPVMEAYIGVAVSSPTISCGCKSAVKAVPPLVAPYVDGCHLSDVHG